MSVAATLFAATPVLLAQGVTTASISGIVKDGSGRPIAGANVQAVHQPSGSVYTARTRADGRVAIPGMRVGGPYRITVAMIGYGNLIQDNVFLALGTATDLEFVMREISVTLDEVVVTGVFSSERTGAATVVNIDDLRRLPTISRTLGDFARLTPQASGSSFLGQDNRLNNVTVDGAYFNNSFGLAGAPGERTGVAPIPLDAIEQVKVSLAPYDVRQGNFVGAGVNTVTKSGTNEFSGTIYYLFRDQDLVGDSAKSLPVSVGTFKYNQIGVSLSGPIIRNKLFFFGNYEGDKNTSPGTTFRANLGGEPIQGGTTRVLKTDLDNLANFLSTNFGYNPGPYEGYDFETPATRFVGKLNFNLNDRNKLSLQYRHLDSDTDVLVSNSSSLGFGTRRSVTDALNFQRSNYIILENIRSIVGEWNAMLGGNKANNLIVGYSSHDESRNPRGARGCDSTCFFPFVDILSAGSVYTSFGFEPFTPNNELRYSSFQLQNNFTIYGNKHDLTFGTSIERYESENVFFPGSQSVYVYNSLADFFTDANDYLANPTRTTSPVTLRRFQLRWSNIPGQEKPVQPLEVLYTGLYAQDEWQPFANLKLTAGLRVDVPFFGNTGYQNAVADAMTFRDENGASVQYQTAKLPDANLLWSPRLGFNLDVFGDRRTQVRGGTGIFTGKPAYVWISNQIGNTGVLTGFERLDNTTARPFHPDPDHYKPATVTGAPASTFELALTDPGFKFPQLWRSDIAVDQELPWGLIGTAEFIYNRDVNGVYYINANLPPADSNFVGPDQRRRWLVDRCPAGGTQANRINCAVDNAIVLKNQNVGYSWNFAASLEKPLTAGFSGKVAYSYGVSKNTVDPGSIAFGSWNNNPHSGDPNNPGVGFSLNSPGHRVFAALSYRREYFSFGATTIAVFWEGRTIGNTSYTFSGDLNGDGGTSNDLIYIPRDTSEMNFQTYTVTVSGTPVTFTRQQQQAAWENFIQQDKYLRTHRGQYAERGAIFLPMVYRADVSITQDLFKDLGGKRNNLQFRLDVINVGNLINQKWGVGQRLVNSQPLVTAGADARGARYRLRNIGNQLLSTPLEQTAGLADVYKILLAIRYTFN
ncbi:MAG TPA: carboxypeptidase regulatory-like domain-containing protein [Gemmatimonadales bacterium]|nr:carboxypeptidase regulatory-like domain-containing protein [Gemmatimonadales bacterium]